MKKVKSKRPGNVVFLPTLTPKSKSSCPGTVANYSFVYRARYPQTMLLPSVPTGGQGCAGSPKVRQKKGAWGSCSSTTAGSASPHQHPHSRASWKLPSPPTGYSYPKASKTPTDCMRRSSGGEDESRWREPLETTHHLASAAETKEAGRESTSAILRSEASAQGSTSGGPQCTALKRPSL